MNQYVNQRILGRYTLEHLLGRGGMGEVWAARDGRLERSVAVKFLAPRGQSSSLSAIEERFRREARYTARIRHSGVPVVHDIGRLEDGRLYLVMELVRGDTLATLLKDGGPFAVPRAAAVAEQTAGVLVRAHGVGVVHRDLKPSNLMLTPSGKVKVLDFGIAAALEPRPDEPRLTTTDGIPGTPGFISPEQADGGPATESSDLYAVGCVLYELLAGVALFAAPTPHALMYKHVYETPRPLGEHRADLPADLAGLVMRLLAKKPQDRPGAAEVRETARRWTVRSPAERPARTGTPERRTDPATLRLPGGRADRASAPGRTAAGDDASDVVRARLRKVLDTQDVQGALALVKEQLHGLSRPLDWVVPAADWLRLFEFLMGAEIYVVAMSGYRGLRQALVEAVPEARDKDILACRAGFARCLAELGRTQEALNAYQALLPAQRSAVGPSDPAVLDMRYEIAAIRARMGDRPAAQRELRDLRHDLMRHLPDDGDRNERVDALLGRLARISRAVPTDPAH
ncbi:serine/threonine-protein kinase [Streptomyces paludis]|uniref:serine/threonine-protein kinase n=1 Tax=Streptomyces paludis TaxID=2282738 RepID=UPI0013B3A9B1|nr:serine/threonine-protein kinase [Streptomyces paludis]